MKWKKKTYDSVVSTRGHPPSYYPIGHSLDYTRADGIIFLEYLYYTPYVPLTCICQIVYLNAIFLPRKTSNRLWA
ncbi:hypothetical protein EJ04DRAFT_512597 [Polyplosphaeria fusca]|uniref:Uncharacterized protein n=1 Tax=Polyplosphaeria fusca TaxID=682080 RepID=A0A9P4UZM0_9PLEO|nr:hypothetical protein EJ04DRAFT_512597 [Polyplosphaeria fusca]